MIRAAIQWTQLSPAEQSAMVLDGDLWRVGMTIVEADTPDDPTGRLRLVAALCPPNVAIVRLSAAWVWQAHDILPQRIHVATTDRRRLTAQRDIPYVTCDLRFGKTDLILGMAGAVTSPSRTATDLARYETHMPEGDVIATLRRLVRVHRRSFGTTDGIIDEVIASKHLPYKTRCLMRLREAIREIT